LTRAYGTETHTHHEGYTMLRLTDDSRAILAECEADARDTWDAADDADVPELTLPCPACGKPVTAPADAEGDDVHCGPECIRATCDRMDAELAAMLPTYDEVAESQRAAGLEEIPF
jgi:hypothetical protein